MTINSWETGSSGSTESCPCDVSLYDHNQSLLSAKTHSAVCKKDATEEIEEKPYVMTGLQIKWHMGVGGGLNMLLMCAANLKQEL